MIEDDFQYILRQVRAHQRQVLNVANRPVESATMHPWMRNAFRVQDAQGVVFDARFAGDQGDETLFGIPVKLDSCLPPWRMEFRYGGEVYQMDFPPSWFPAD